MIEKKNGEMRFHIETVGTRFGTSLLAHGVRHIEDLGCEKIVLRVGGGRVYVLGRALSASAFQNKAVEVKGWISEVKLSYDKS